MVTRHFRVREDTATQKKWLLWEWGLKSRDKILDLVFHRAGSLERIEDGCGMRVDSMEKPYPRDSDLALATIQFEGSESTLRNRSI